MAANTEDLEEGGFRISVHEAVSIVCGLHKFLVGDNLNSLVCAYTAYGLMPFDKHLHGVRFGSH